MRILALECSAAPASAAVLEDGKVLAFVYSHVKATHSHTLLPMAESALNAAMVSFDGIDALAVSNGPGSFTGIRIGISAVKGLAAPRNLPCVGVSTLLSMAYQLIGQDAVICAVMDARRQQVYNALFEIRNGEICRLCEDRAVSCENLAENVKKVSQNGTKRVIIVGDGTSVFVPYVKDLPGVSAACERDRYQNAVAVGLAAEKALKNGETVSPAQLLPVYLRLPQAERELRRKKGDSV
ncbi:MAG: tRNA (adenosine(37)-N6)-threonylcarbamoyltransferase complex dimerization subunit type 1 TsaB [Clostridia bacterium]|nr:tRNA (adenosine(37)-N6)-threonylcarbamoyltransferase complex dimerization subunit type 1 TsaB [Clostridia bacterium]